MSNGAVILDVDGTLVDSNDAHARAWVDAFAARGITVPFEEIRRAMPFAQIPSLTSRTS